MKCIFILVTLLVAILIVGCNSKQPDTAKEQEIELIFPKGDKITNNNFTGTAWLQMFVNNDSIYNASVGNVTFEPGARTNWHKHPGGQILLVTEGLGYYQEKGKPAQVIKKGDIVKIPPGAEHWHGASPDSGLTHIAISTNMQKGNVVWLEPVTDEVYNESVQFKTNKQNE